MSASEIDAYIAAAKPRHAERLRELRALIHRLVPGIEETIDWKMPVFRAGERYLPMASRAGYFSLYIGQTIAADIIAAVPGVRHGKGCLNIGDRIVIPPNVLEAAVRKRLLGD